MQNVIIDQNKRPRTRPPERQINAIIAGVATSLSLHLGILVAVIIASQFGHSPEEVVVQEDAIIFDNVELLALGKERPKEQLPRMANPEPQPPTPVVSPQQKPEPVVKPEPVRASPEPQPAKKTAERSASPSPKKDDSVDEQQKRQRRMQEALSALHNPNRPTNDDVAEGSELGTPGGRLSDAAMDHLLGSYQAQFLAEIDRFWQIPGTISSTEIADLAGEVWVYVELSSSGNIVNYVFRKRSSNEQFNASIENVLKRFHARFGGRALPLPENDQVRRAVLTRGLELRDWENLGLR